VIRILGGRGGLTFRATQLITGHGSFGDYLMRIGRVASLVCPHCGGGLGSAYPRRVSHMGRSVHTHARATLSRAHSRTRDTRTRSRRTCENQ